MTTPLQARPRRRGSNESPPGASGRTAPSGERGPEGAHGTRGERLPWSRSLALLLGLLLIALLAPPSAASQQWTPSFIASQGSPETSIRGGSEVLHLTGHGGRLFAAVGYWQDGGNVYYGGRDPRKGWARILRLDAPDGEWEVDLELGPGHLRPEVLASVTFGTDGDGDALESPVTLLVACAFATGFSGTAVHCFVRGEDAPGWTKVRVLAGPRGRSEAFSVRDLHIHRDSVTGVDRAFLTIGTHGIFSGVYDPKVPGGIAWESAPEFGPVEVRPLGITTANGSLVFSSGARIYRRVDGPEPSYVVAHDLSDLAPRVRSDVGGIRGLTAIAAPEGHGESLLFMWSPDGAAKGEMIRLDRSSEGPLTRHREVALADLIRDYTGATEVQYVLGAYNDLLAVDAPGTDAPGTDAPGTGGTGTGGTGTGAKQHLVGLEFRGAGPELPIWKRGYYRGALYAVRDPEGRYRMERVGGPDGADDAPLVATRCYAPSPFAGDGSTFFGGHDPNGITSTNMAWIYRRAAPQPPRDDSD